MFSSSTSGQVSLNSKPATTGVVTIYISPLLHVGFSKDLRNTCTVQPPESHGTSESVGGFVTGWSYPGRPDAWDKLKNYRVANGRMLLNQLNLWHREGFDDGVDRLMSYEALMNLLIKDGVDSFQ
jgi:hypothetical protein